VGIDVYVFIHATTANGARDEVAVVEAIMFHLSHHCAEGEGEGCTEKFEGGKLKVAMKVLYYTRLLA